MKKLVIVLLISLMLAPVLAAGTKESVSVAAIVMLFKGDVQILPAGSAKWAKPVVGMSVKAKDIIKTGADSWLNIAFANGSIMRVSQNSTVEISLLSYDTKKKILKSESRINIMGKVIASCKKLKKDQNTYDFYTPTAVAGVRGTELMVDVKDQETTYVAVFEGKLIVKDLVGEQGISKDDNEMMLDFLREAVVNNNQVLEYKKGKGLPKAKAMGKEYDADKKLSKQVKEESLKLTASLAKKPAEKQWSNADQLRKQAQK
ncbi:MAG: FecR family protein, partial [bacterium]|nr:FecR family protein [bacterium]